MVFPQPTLNSHAGNVWRWLRRVSAGLFLITAVPVLVLRWVPPPTSTFMLIDRLEAGFEGDWHASIDYQWAAWPDISPEAKLAVVAAEDQSFAEHLGFDLQAMRRAFELNRGGRRLRGGSTITQQTAKNLFLYPGKSYIRKMLEAYFTLLMELSWPKQRILEVYLNIAQFGQGVYGIGAAAHVFFGKPPARLDAREAARLAAVLPNPRLLRVDQPSTHVNKREQWILEQMRRLGGRHYLETL